MTICKHVLDGCAPVPLAGYLKALGVFRLVAEQSDVHAESFWRNERYALRTALDQESLVTFFVSAYNPTPVVAPWNGGSGFWPGDNREGFEIILASRSDRLAPYRAAIKISQEIVRRLGITEAPKEASKAKLIAELRSNLSDSSCRWLDGALALTAEGPRYPPILGTGGNDGRLDFSNNFMRRLTDVFEREVAESEELLRAALFGAPSSLLDKGAVGQFAPGSAGGVNAGNGFEADSRVNPWDFILTIEGALAFGAAAVRRFAEDRSASLSYPFTTRTVGAGSGTTSLADEGDARAEFWAPIWSRPVTIGEMLQLMSEGRAILNGGGVRDGLDFARAVARLGVARGIDTFYRHAFLKRAGKAYFATPLGRIKVRENPGASLISELDASGWLSRVRNATRGDGTSASFAALGRSFDESLFGLAANGLPETVQNALVAIGRLMLEVARRPKLRLSDRGSPPVPVPPRLSVQWVDSADDGSQEFALAEAIASIDAQAGDFCLPFRRHLVPLDWPKGREGWSDTTEATAMVVWTGRDLIRDMTSVLQRRLIEAQRHKFVDQNRNAELPLRGWRAAPLAAIAAFLAGATDGARISALAAGLAWTRSRTNKFSLEARSHEIPFAYTALKPVFSPRGASKNSGEPRLIDPSPVVRLLVAGRTKDSLVLAQKMMRAAGFAAPFRRVDAMPPFDIQRLLAALTFPISPMAENTLVSRAYPDEKKDEEVIHVD